MATVTIEQLTYQKLAARIAEDAVTIAMLTAQNEFLAQTIQQLSAANAESDEGETGDVEAESERPSSNRRAG